MLTLMIFCGSRKNSQYFLSSLDLILVFFSQIVSYFSKNSLAIFDMCFPNITSYVFYNFLYMEICFNSIQRIKKIDHLRTLYYCFLIPRSPDDLN